MEIALIIVWIIRILLPVLIFWIYFRWNSSNDHAEQKVSVREARHAGPKISRAALLEHRKVARNWAAHSSLPRMVNQVEAPALFEGHEPEPRAEASPKKERQSPKSEILEPLLNYMALCRKEEQGGFFSSANPEKANADARKILRGAAHMKKAGVPLDVYKQLTESGAQVEERTFAQMLEASVRAVDLNEASPILMSMEAAGFRPADSLLDKVMELYEKQYHALPMLDAAKARLSSHAPIFVPTFSASARSRSASPELSTSPAPEGRSTSPGQRTALNPTARPFPLFVVSKTADNTNALQRTPFPKSDNQQRTALSTMAAPFNPNLGSTRQRTALSAMALPFSAIA